MSNALAIATVTTALAAIAQKALDPLGGALVVTSRPDASATPARRVHLFLYQVMPNPALRNLDLPARNAEGRLVQRPHIALDLHYLLAFYGNENELEPQRMLGAVARDLHARPVLTRQMISDAVASQPFLTGSNLVDAVEQVKFTPTALNLEELSKLWSVLLQTPYVLTATYQATVVLIEAEENAPLPLPVLKRGREDRGVETQLGRAPFLEGLHIGEPGSARLQPRPRSYPSAQFGTQLTLLGSNLSGDSVEVRFRHPRLTTVETVIPPTTSASEIQIDLPQLADPAAVKDKWAAGIYTVDAVIHNGTVVHTTSALALPLAPRIVKITPTWPTAVAIDGSGNATITVECSPQVLPSQTVMLLLADREVAAEPHPVATDTLSFVVSAAPQVTDELVRLRVDGVNSLPFISTGTPAQLAFDDNQRVTIQ